MQGSRKRKLETFLAKKTKEGEKERRKLLYADTEPPGSGPLMSRVPCSS